MRPELQRVQTTAAKPQWFATTHWSVVLAAGGHETPQAADALEKLCRTYWYPLYAYLRRDGCDVHDAEDLTQEFFARFLAKDYLKDMNRQKGKFRSFLLMSLKHFLANEWDRSKRVKRGGQFTFISWDQALAERRFGKEPAHELTPEKLYERRWALTLLEQALERLKKEYAAAGKARLYDALQGYLSEETTAPAYAELAGCLGMNEGAVRVALHRLRRRFGELLRSEIAHTVASPDEVEEEVRHLFATFSG